jgi:TPR repeat protein
MGNSSSSTKATPAPKESGQRAQPPRQVGPSAAERAQAEQVKIKRRTELFQLAQQYQVDTPEQAKDLDKAFDCYLEAARLGHPEAMEPLTRLGEEVSAAKQLTLGSFYGSFFHNPEKETYWREKASEVAEFRFKA